MTSRPAPTTGVGPNGTVGIVMPIADPRGGCETMLLNLLRANRDGPGQPYAVCFLEDGPMVAQVADLGYPTTVLPVGRLRHLHRYAAGVVRLARWFRRERVDLAMAWMEKAHLYVGPASRLARVPAAWWLHSISPDNRLMKLVTALPAEHLFAASQAALDARNPRWRRHPASVCHCAVDLRRFSSDTLPSVAEARRSLSLPADRTVVGTVARMQRWKGVDVFIRAAAEVVLRCRAADQAIPRFVVVGGEHALEPGVRQELEALVAHLQLANHMSLVGHQSDVPIWMQACDVVVHSATGIEPFGTVIVEAMALGKCVVAANAGGPREVITDGVDGRLTRPGDDHALADAIIDLLADTPSNAALRAAARRRASDFSADRLAQCVATGVAELLKP